MARIVVMPKLGLSMEEGTISKRFKKEGDKVELEDPIFEVETEKMTNEVQADTAGILRKIIVKEGETVECTVPVAIIAGADEDISGLI